MKTKTLTVQRAFYSTKLYTRKGKFVHTANSFREAVTSVMCDSFGVIDCPQDYQYKLKIAKLSSNERLPSPCGEVFTVVGTEIRDADGIEWESPMFVLHKLQSADYEGEPEVVHVCIKYTNRIFGKTNIGDMFVVTDITRKELE